MPVFGTLTGGLGLQPPCAAEYLTISTTSTATVDFIVTADVQGARIIIYTRNERTSLLRIIGNDNAKIVV